MENFKGTKGSDLTYPLSTEELSDRFYDGVELQAGLTKREYFAAMALQGLCANPEYVDWSDEKVSRMAVGEADRLIEALNK
ncbi:hypothetical protein FKG96_09965 [Olivibacter sp. LS-1]|uniref:hypothetical protein n=1 Tax=Olivibacter sp. LS-1 TaxID=2592345 RepID=UPI0011EB0D03|nr:hypothetical protein [Olivibacter sp. LS-1]QEL01119.1 hypothetical protein FKG96_09965 [Olivibacter sp. LS-1]